MLEGASSITRPPWVSSPAVMGSGSRSNPADSIGDGPQSSRRRGPESPGHPHGQLRRGVQTSLQRVGGATSPPRRRRDLESQPWAATNRRSPRPLLGEAGPLPPRARSERSASGGAPQTGPSSESPEASASAPG